MSENLPYKRVVNLPAPKSKPVVHEDAGDLSLTVVGLTKLDDAAAKLLLACIFNKSANPRFLSRRIDRDLIGSAFGSKGGAATH